MINYILTAIMVVLCAVVLPMAWKRFDRFVQQHCPHLSQGFALHIKLSFVTLVLLMALEAIFNPKTGMFKVENFVSTALFGIVIFWFASVLTYWLLLRKGLESCLKAGVIKSPLLNNKPPPIIVLKMVTILAWLLLVFLGLLLVAAHNIEWVVEHTPWMVNWLIDGEKQ